MTPESILARYLAAGASLVTYMKLRDGTWGLRIEGSASPGETVTVKKRDGSAKKETVGKIIWRGDGIMFASIGAPEVAKSTYPNRDNYNDAPLFSRQRPYECDECGEWVQPGTSCWETGAIH